MAESQVPQENYRVSVPTPLFFTFSVWLRKSCPQKSAVVLPVKAKVTLNASIMERSYGHPDMTEQSLGGVGVVGFFVLGMWKETLQRGWTIPSEDEGNPVLIRFLYSTSDNTLTQTCKQQRKLDWFTKPKVQNQEYLDKMFK